MTDDIDGSGFRGLKPLSLVVANAAQFISFLKKSCICKISVLSVSDSTLMVWHPSIKKKPVNCLLGAFL